MKMSDVFELPVSRDGFKLKDRCGVSEEIHVAKFADVSACVYVELAINNYDRMADEIAFLSETKAQLIKVGHDTNKDLRCKVDLQSVEIAELREVLRQMVYLLDNGYDQNNSYQEDSVIDAKNLLNK